MVTRLKTPHTQNMHDGTRLSHLRNLSLVPNLFFTANQAQKECLRIFPLQTTNPPNEHGHYALLIKKNHPDDPKPTPIDP